MENKYKHITDPLEKRILKILLDKDIKFITETEKEYNLHFKDFRRRLDFYLPDYRLFIEVKARYTDRIADQLKVYEDYPTITIIGESGIEFLETIINNNNNK